MPTSSFRMTLNPGCADEYKRRHDSIWPELVDALKAAGIEDYRIFLDEKDGALFAIMTHRGALRLEELPKLPVMRRWWVKMADIMRTRENGVPIEIELTQMFSLDEHGHGAGKENSGDI